MFGIHRSTSVLLVVLFAATDGWSIGVDKQELLNLLRSAEQQLRNAEFTVRREHYDISRDGVAGAKTGKWEQVSGTIGAAPEARYIAVFETSSPDTNTGKERHSKYRKSFDGALGMLIEELENSSSSEMKPYRGEVNSGPDKMARFMTTDWGALSLVPAFYQATGLSRYLESIPANIPEWRILESGRTDIVRIWHPLNDSKLMKQEQRSYVLDIDLSKGCAIVGYEVHVGVGTFRDEPSHETLFYLASNIEHIEINGQWLPKSYSFNIKGWHQTEHRPNHSDLSLYSFEWANLNRDDSELSYTLEFPKGLRVNDKVTGIKYTVGTSEKEYDSFLSSAVSTLKETVGIESLTIPQSKSPNSDSVEGKRPVAIQDSRISNMRALVIGVGALSTIALVVLRVRRQKS